MKMIEQNIPTFIHAGKFVTLVPTSALAPGMRLVLATVGRTSKAPVIRTVKEILPSEYVNHRDEPIVYVMYTEGRTEDWSEGNSGIAETLWTVVV